MSTMTFKVTLSGNNSTNTKRIHIIGTNLNIDYGDGTTTIQEPNTERIDENHTWTRPDGVSSFTWNITITGNIVGLGEYFLNSSHYIEEINLPEGLRIIEYGALMQTYINEIVIPSTVTSIGGNFLANSLVEKVIMLTKNFTSMSSQFLYNCTHLKSINLPEGLQTLGAGSFYNCISLKNLELPSTLTSITGSTTFRNVQLETLKFNNGPISNPPINENTKIIVPLNKLQDFINHSSYPNDESRYDYYGTNISSAVYVSGKHMADKLMERGVTASADDGLTTLANKILQIPSMTYHQEIVSLRFDDDNNIKGSRPEQVPFKLCTSDGVMVTGCLLPMDKTGPTAHIYGYPDGVRYNVEVPDKDQNNNTLTYEWGTYLPPEGYVLQKPEFNDNTFMFSGLFEHKISLRIVDNNSDIVSPSDIVSISVKMNADYNPDGTEITLTKSDFIYDDGYYVASVQGFAYQPLKRLWTDITIALDSSKYISPLSYSLSVTKQANGDTVASATIRAIFVPTIIDDFTNPI